MKRNKKRWGIAACCLVFCFVTGLIGARIYNQEFGYNNNPDLGSKVVASKNMMLERIIPQSTEELADGAKYIYIGEVLDDGKVSPSYNLLDGVSGKEAIFEKWGGEELFEQTGTLSTVRVTQVLAGEEPEEETIMFFQFGAPGVDDMQTKLRKGDRVLLLLNDSGLCPGAYCSYSFEDCVFYIEEDEKLRSMSDTMVCARYDGLKKDRLVQDLRNTQTVRQIMAGQEPS